MQRMLSSQPSFQVQGGRQVVRVYNEDEQSQTSDQIEELEHEESGQEQSGPEELQRGGLTAEELLLENQAIVDAHAQSWTLRPRAGVFSGNDQVQIVVKPTASAMDHSFLNPWVYRNLGPVNSLDHFAEIMKAPKTWRQQYDQVMAANNYCLERAFQDFRSLPDDTRESTIHGEFIGLVKIVSVLSGGTHISSFNGNPVTVGGFLARNHYDVRSQTDPHFVDRSSVRNMFATEIKRANRLKAEVMCLRGCTGVQVMTALYAYACPTFLFSQQYWKIFVENDDRKQVLTYPFGSVSGRSSYGNSTDMAPMGHDFLRAIVICLLSKRGIEKAGESSGVTVQAGSSVSVTPEKTGRVPDRSLTDQVPPKRHKTHHKTTKPPAPLKFSDIVPSFVSGYENGQPVRTFVRVLSESETDEIEAAIEREEKEERRAALALVTSDGQD